MSNFDSEAHHRPTEGTRYYRIIMAILLVLFAGIVLWFGIFNGRWPV